MHGATSVRHDVTAYLMHAAWQGAKQSQVLGSGSAMQHHTTPADASTKLTTRCSGLSSAYIRACLRERGPISPAPTWAVPLVHSSRHSTRV